MNELVTTDVHQKLTFSTATLLIPSGHITDTKWRVGVLHSNYNIVQKTKLPPETSIFSDEYIGLVKAIEYIFC